MAVGQLPRQPGGSRQPSKVTARMASDPFNGLTWETITPKIVDDLRTGAPFRYPPGGPDVEIYVPCPKCEPSRTVKGKKPLGVNPHKGAWYCWHCSAAGSLAKGGWTDDPDYGALKSIRYLPPPAQPAPETEADKLYKWLLEKRGLDRELLDDEKVQVVMRWCKVCQDHVPQVAFRYFKNGDHVHTKYRCAAKHFSSDKQTDRCLYGYDSILGDDQDPTGQVIITEGEIDALTLRKLGYDRVVSMPDGAQAIASMIDRARRRGQDTSKLDFTQARISWLDDEKVARALTQARRVILCIDGDEEGQALAAEVARRIGLDRTRSVRWPDGLKDANEAFTQKGPDTVHQAINDAEPYPVEGLLSVSDFEEELDRILEDGLPDGLSTGFKNIDKRVRIQLGQTWFIHGYASSGKSHLLNTLLVEWVELYGWNVAIFSPEWQPVSLHAIALMEVYLRKSAKKSGGLTAEEKARGKQWLKDHFTFMLPKDRTVSSIIDKMTILRARKGCQVFLLDPWLELHHPVGNHDKLDYIEKAISDLQEFWRQSKALGIVAHHPGKPPAGSKGNKKPGQMEESGMYGFRDASGFTQKADVIMEVQMKPNNKTRLIIQKVRMRHLGHPGDAWLDFDYATGRFSDGQPPEELVYAKKGSPSAGVVTQQGEKTAPQGSSVKVKAEQMKEQALAATG